jgi:hypothetical protein
MDSVAGGSDGGWKLDQRPTVESRDEGVPVQVFRPWSRLGW